MFFTVEIKFSQDHRKYYMEEDHRLSKSLIFVQLQFLQFWNKLVCSCTHYTDYWFAFRGYCQPVIQCSNHPSLFGYELLLTLCFIPRKYPAHSYTLSGRPLAFDPSKALTQLNDMVAARPVINSMDPQRGRVLRVESPLSQNNVGTLSKNLIWVCNS